MTAVVVFACGECGAVITVPLLPWRDGLCYEDGEAAVPRGHFALSDDDYRTGSTGQVLVNVDDVVGTSSHPDSRRSQGCCGLDGTEGPNLVCPSSHEVATACTDCWMSHAAVLVPNVVRQ